MQCIGCVGLGLYWLCWLGAVLAVLAWGCVGWFSVKLGLHNGKWHFLSLLMPIANCHHCLGLRFILPCKSWLSLRIFAMWSVKWAKCSINVWCVVCSSVSIMKYTGLGTCAWACASAVCTLHCVQCATGEYLTFVIKMSKSSLLTCFRAQQKIEPNNLIYIWSPFFFPWNFPNKLSFNLIKIISFCVTPPSQCRVSAMSTFLMIVMKCLCKH